LETIHVTRAGQGEHLQVVSDIVTIKASGRDTSGLLVVLEARVPPGGGPPVLHRHPSAETFYILDGTFEFTCLASDEQASKVTAGAGDTVAIASQVWHNFKNIGATPGRFLAIHSSAEMEDFAREIGEPIEDPLNPPVPTGPPTDEQRQRMMSIITKYMEVAPLPQSVA
jgi:mannose-6-phosphate isomerase-like protein (cupin superfamily)